MIQHTAKPIMKRIVEAEELLKSIHDPEERLAIENYIGNLYDSVHELEKTPNTFSFENYLGAKEFSGSSRGLEAMMRIMDVVGVDTWEDLKGKFVRVEKSSLGQPITTIGNLIKNNWFDIKEFFKND